MVMLFLKNGHAPFGKIYKSFGVERLYKRALVLSLKDYIKEL
jgi:hypothetical protein